MKLLTATNASISIEAEMKLRLGLIIYDCKSIVLGTEKTGQRLVQKKRNDVTMDEE